MEDIAGTELPVIDLAPAFPEADRRSKLAAACEGLGCFRVVNHGIPAALQAEMKAAVRYLLDLPDGAKRVSNMDVIAGSGYVGPTAENPLYEAMGLYDAAKEADVEDFCGRLLVSTHQREIIKSYASKIHDLAVHLSNILAESLGLSTYSFEDWPCQFRLNKYNFKQETVGSSGVCTHTDGGFLTVLQEDDAVGGLEVMDRRTGKFLPVDPVPGSFLVNLGDVAKAWSNGRLHNVKHRVQCKAAAVRVSIALFVLAPKDDIVEAPAEFVDAEHPRLYKSISYEEYRKLRLSTGERDGEALSLIAFHQDPTKI